MIQAKSLTVARPLFVATILAGSFLLFLVQPMVARMALPRLGGAPNVWNSAMLVYQALLLAGYAYAHRLSRMPVAHQAKLHLLLLAVGAVMLPITLYRLPPPAPGWEVLWVPLLFLLTIGPVFFIVSSQAPLMQRWFTGHPDAGEPWALYAASNLGSFAGLIAYPLLAEPLLSLDQQSLVWAIGYGLLIVLVALSARARWNVAVQSPVPQTSVQLAERIGSGRTFQWLALSAVPSGLMLSTTTHLTTDIFAMPLLWVIPLGLYLLSFVIAFADNRGPGRAVTVAAPPLMLFAGGLAMVSNHSGGIGPVFASIALLFVVAVALHVRLYDLRPHPAQLTRFYLVMSAGGALGGAFTAILAPAVFDWVWEHPLLVMAAALLMPLPELFKWRRLPGLDPAMARLTAWLLLALAVLLALSLYAAVADTAAGIHQAFLTAMLCGIGLLLLHSRMMFVAVLVLLMLAQGGVRTIEKSMEDRRQRSYFGVHTVLDSPSRQLRMLVHGTTLHGQQSTEPGRRLEPLTYYGPNSGAAILMAQVPELFGPSARVGILGLGAGTLACLRTPGQDWTFFEIDPVVVELSRNRTFTFLEECAPEADIVLGDARLEIGKYPKGAFDVLVADAFSSDSVPLHLITDEAMAVYLRALSDDGVLLVHISNRYLQLEPILSALARKHGLSARMRTNTPQDQDYLSPSDFVALSRNPESLKALAEARPDAPWKELGPPAPRVWTDNHASILPYINWKKLLGGL
ncbi:MAG: fused MFS/spermidine synthase [Novosphingobium sp.]|nr:fused MFS/spermidine synthase [Novosphingobium sp.]